MYKWVEGRRLVDDLEGVARWVETNKLKLNGQKKQLLLLSRKRRAQELEQVEIDRDGWPENRKDKNIVQMK